MQYHFYNSFSNGAGYCHADYINGVPVQMTRKLPVELDLDYMNGGCKLVLRVCRSYAYLLVKKITYVNNNRTHLQQGRTVNINFSIETSLDKKEELFAICAGILSEWNNFCHRMGDIITIPASNIFNYDIDENELHKLFNYIAERGKNPVLPSDIAKAIRNSTHKGVLIVPIGSLDNYCANLSSITNDSRNPSVQWGCVIPASCNKNNPYRFEILTEHPATENYEDFLRSLSDFYPNDGSQTELTQKISQSDNEPHESQTDDTNNDKEDSATASNDENSTDVIDKGSPILNKLRDNLTITIILIALISFMAGLLIARLFK